MRTSGGNQNIIYVFVNVRYDSENENLVDHMYDAAWAELHVGHHCACCMVDHTMYDAAWAELHVRHH